MSQYVNEAIEFYQDILNVNLMDELNIKYKVLDDIDFFNECKKETGSTDFSTFLVLSIPKTDEECSILLLINDYLENNQDNYGLEILYSQLTNIYLNNNETINNLIKECRYLPFSKKTRKGIAFWKEYFSIYFTQTVLKEYNIEEIEDEENPYNPKKSLKIGLNFLNKALNSKNKSYEERLSLLLYSLAKISLSEDNASNAYDLKTFIENENLKKPIQKIYECFSSKGFEDITVLQFLQVGKMVIDIEEELKKI